ncbi:hypothetical protein PSI15_10755 [Xenorhabdus sp. PR6a]|uniref:hypothetical protein n=1 Tax=Xenorhabdus sp. PR6a TaxID=3025877 RepID=UPI0023586C6C|nr:hypothetical protein [Xenorhabdus sp. PR6a]MDC9582039.1 hypothetical protein [Xenorhabdus sp. PR6a]
MPFFVPFRTKYFLGDLIYGMKKQRARYIDTVDKFRDAQPYFDENAWPPVFIDDYLVSSEEEYMRGFIKRESVNNQDNSGMEQSIRIFRSRLKYSDTHPDQFPKYTKDFSKHLRHDKKYHSVLEENGGLDTLNLGRKCKGGLSWVSKSKSQLVRDIHVHFILDDINMQWVADKHEEFERKSITGKELRWLFRHRNHPKVSQKVQFWRNGQPVSPPWNGEESHIWDNYERKLMEKGGAGEEERYDGLSRLFKILCCGV